MRVPLLISVLAVSLAGCRAAHLPVPREVSALGASSVSRPDAARRQARLRAQAGLALLLHQGAVTFVLRRADRDSLLEVRLAETRVTDARVEFEELPGGGVLARAHATRPDEAMAELEGLATHSASAALADPRPELALVRARQAALRALVLQGLGPGREALRCEGVLTLVDLQEHLGPGGARVEVRGSVRVLEREPLDPQGIRDLVREAAAERDGLGEVVKALEEAAEGAQRMP